MKKINWLFMVFFILAVTFRFINIDKSGGLWYDEAVIYSIASKQDIGEMLIADTQRFAMFPLYYVMYNFWISIFGNSDFIIRLMSVFFDVLAMITAYFVGKQFAYSFGKISKNTGLWCLILYGINSSFVYYAQEAKFYSMTFFMVNLVILCWLKFIKQFSNKHLILLLLCNYLLFLVNTSQILLIIILLLISIWYCVKNRQIKKSIFYFLGILPLIILCIIFRKYYSGNFDAVVFDNSFILLAIQNWFTPALEGLQNNILNYHKYIFMNILDIRLCFYVLLPVGIVFYATYIALKKYSITRYLFCVSCLYIIMHILLTYFTNYSVLVRYTLPVLPIFIFIAAIGISEMNKWLVSVFVIICSLIIISPIGAVNIKRPDGYKTLAVALYSAKINPQNDFIMPIRIDLLDKYYSISGLKNSIYILNSEEAMKTYLTDEEILGIQNDKNKHKYIKRYINEDIVPKSFEKYIINNFIKDNNIVLIVDKSIAILSDEQLKILLKSNLIFESYPFQFIRMSKLTNDLKSVLAKNMKLKKHISENNWEIYEFSK